MNWIFRIIDVRIQILLPLPSYRWAAYLWMDVLWCSYTLVTVLLSKKCNILEEFNLQQPHYNYTKFCNEAIYCQWYKIMKQQQWELKAVNWCFENTNIQNVKTKRLEQTIFNIFKNLLSDRTMACVYWTVHHCNSWRIKDQLDVTCYFISSSWWWVY